MVPPLGRGTWMPAFAGMTGETAGMTDAAGRSGRPGEEESNDATTPAFAQRRADNQR